MSTLYIDYARPLSNFCIKELRQKLLEWKNSLRDELQGLKLLRSNINKNQGKIKRNEELFKSKITELINRFENVILNELETITSIYYEIERNNEIEVNSKIYVKFELLRENYNKIMMNINRLLIFSNGNNNVKNSVFDKINSNELKTKLEKNKEAFDNNQIKDNFHEILSKSPVITHRNYDESKTPKQYDIDYDISYNTHRMESKSNVKTSKANGNIENTYNVDNELKEIEERINNMKTKTNVEKTNKSKTNSKTSKINNLKNSRLKFAKTKKDITSSKGQNVSYSNMTNKSNIMNTKINSNSDNKIQSKSNFYELNKEIEIIKNYVFDLKQKVNESTPIDFKKDNYLYLKDNYLKLKNDKEIMRRDLDDLSASFKKIENNNYNLTKENADLKNYNELLLTFIYDKFPDFDPGCLFSVKNNKIDKDIYENKMDKTRNKLISTTHTNSSKGNVCYKNDNIKYDRNETKSTKENFSNTNNTNPFLNNKNIHQTNNILNTKKTIDYYELEKDISNKDMNEKIFNNNDYYEFNHNKSNDYLFNDNFNNNSSVELKKVLNQQNNNKTNRYLIPKK